LRGDSYELEKVIGRCAEEMSAQQHGWGTIYVDDYGEHFISLGRRPIGVSERTYNNNNDDRLTAFDPGQPG